MRSWEACVPLLCLVACIRAPVAPDPSRVDEAALRTWMDRNLGGIREARISARVHMQGALGSGQVRLDGDWSTDRGVRLILRTPLGSELARLDPGGTGLQFSDPALAPLLDHVEQTLLGDLLSGALAEQGRLGLLLWGDLRPGTAARLHSGESGAVFVSGDSTWQVDGTTALCHRLEYPGTRLQLERFHRVAGRWQPRLLRLVQSETATRSAHSVVVEYLDLELRHQTPPPRSSHNR